MWFLRGKKEIPNKLDENPHLYGDTTVNNRIRGRIAKHVVGRYVTGPRVLVLGYCKDPWPQELLDKGFQVEIIEGAKEFADDAKAKFGGSLTVHHTLFEKFETDNKFNTVISGSVIEHVPDPGDHLQMIKKWLAPDGRLIVTTTNPNSFHRLVGRALGESETLNQRAKDTMVLRMYDPDSLSSLVKYNGYKIIQDTSLFMKFLNDEKMAQFDDEMMDAFMKAGFQFRDHGRETVIVAALTLPPETKLGKQPRPPFPLIPDL